MSSLPQQFQDYMVDLVKNTMEYREQNNIFRKDFLQLLMELRKTGQISNGDSFESAENATTKNQSTAISLSIEQCAAQVGVYYLAGFDTTASAISNTLFELSRKPELQKRLQDEIDSVLAKHDNAITYDSIKDMPFLDMCVKGNVQLFQNLNSIFCFYYQFGTLICSNKNEHQI